MKGKLRRVLAAVLAFCLTVGQLGFSPVIEADENFPETEGKVTGNITLHNDVTISEPLYIEGDVTIDLNGHTITNKNEKTRANDGDLSMFIVNSGNSLTISGTGTLDQNNKNDRIIRVNDGGRLTINGGTYTKSKDGAIFATGNNAYVTMNGGTITQNETQGNGGGICTSEYAHLTLNGGSITYNKANLNGECKWGEYGGGGIYSGGNFEMNDGDVSNNIAAAGGGIFANFKWWQQGTTFTMHGGTITNNTSTKREGGGLRIGADVTATIKADEGKDIRITGNHCNNPGDWGGGGIFVSEDATLTIYSAVIYNNTAEGFGGGLAGCPTGYNYVMSTEGAAIYGNRAYGKDDHFSGGDSVKTKDHEIYNSDPMFRLGAEGPYQDYFCANGSIIHPYMLGTTIDENGKPDEEQDEGQIVDPKWTGDVDGVVYTNPITEDFVSTDYSGLKANPTQDDINDAREVAYVFIEGNYSNTHGGGIMNNGILFFGQVKDNKIEASFKPKVQKIVKDPQGNKVSSDDTFKFNLYESDESGNLGKWLETIEVAGGKMGYFSEIKYNDFAENEYKRTYYYVIEEVRGDDVLYNYDESRYLITVPVNKKVVKEANGDQVVVYYVDNGKDNIDGVEYNRLKYERMVEKEPGVWEKVNASMPSQLMPSQADFTNEVKSGSLSLKKEVVGDVEAGKTFTFKVTLTPPEGTTPEKLSEAIKVTKGNDELKDAAKISDGKVVVTVELKKDEQINIKNLPLGTEYAVEETGVDDHLYTSTLENSTGTVAAGTPNISLNCTNTVKETGDLIVKKTVTGDSGDQTKEFNLKVELSDTTISGKYGDMEFKAGVATFTLTNGQAKTATDLPVGTTYTVTETEANENGYTTTYTRTVTGASDSENTNQGTITKNKTDTVTVTNDRGVGSLSLTKKVTDPEGNPVESDDTEFTFTVTFTDPDELTDLDYSYSNSNGTNGTIKSGGMVTFNQNETVTFTGIKFGTRYTVTEATSEDYEGTIKNGEGTIDSSHKEVTVTATNEKKEFTGFSVTKEVVGETDSNQLFNFTVVLNGNTATPKVTGPNGETIKPKDGTTNTFAFTLTSGQKATFEHLSIGTTYTVTEAAAADYVASVEGGMKTANGDMAVSGPANGSTVEFVNTAVGSLKVTKTVTGNNADKTKDFHFTVTLNKALSGTYGEMSFTDGKAEFTLKDGQTMTATGLPTGITYTVTEKEANQDGYTTTATGDKGTITKGTPATAAFINDRDTGSLIVKKTVTGNNADKTKDFHFTVTLSDKSVNGTCGGMTFTNGVAEFTLKNGQTKTATGLPTGITYTVTEAEANQDGYTTTATGDKGTITKDIPATAAFVNHKDEFGSFSVKKTATGGNPTDSFEFTVTLAGNKETPTITHSGGGNVAQNGNTFTFSLKSGETVTFSHLTKTTTYTVTEKAAAGYVASVAGGAKTASGDMMVSGSANGSTVEFVNTAVGSLTVTKTVTGEGGDPNKDFTFTVELSDKTISGTYGEMTFANGVATFALKHGKSKTATDLPAGINYTVTEAEANQDDYTTTASGESGEITKGETKTAAFINNKDIDKGSLTVTKTVTGEGGDPNKDFTFTVELSDKTISGTYGEMTFENGVAEFTLKHGDTKTATDLPAGITYTVTEAEANQDDYTTTATNATGTIAKDATATAEFINDKDIDKGSLTVTKTVTGEGGDPNKDFTFTVTLSDTTINGVYGGMTFTDGKSEFTLKHGESKTATDLPAGITYTVTEAEANQDDYTTTATDDEGTITKDAPATAAFTNTKNQYGVLKVTKTVSMGDAEDYEKLFNITVELDDKTVTGDHSAVNASVKVNFVDGVATFQIKANQTVTIEKLPVGVGYTVTEAEAGQDGFATTYNGVVATEDGAKGKIAASEQTVEIVNSKTPQVGSLTVTKKVSGGTAEGKTFTVIITLNTTSDKVVVPAGVTKEIGAESTVITAAIPADGSVTIGNIPAGTTYTVVEDETSKVGYIGVVSYDDDDKVIEADGTDTVTVTNTVEQKFGSLTLTKTVTGALGDRNTDFTFTVVLDGDGIADSYSTGEKTFSKADGNIFTVKLKSGESFTFDKLPAGTKYTVVEVEAGADGYTTTAKVNGTVVEGATANGTIPADASENVEYINEKSAPNETDLTVTKHVVGDFPADRFTFTVTLSDTAINGAYGDMTFVNGVATFDLGNGESATATKLPVGITYTVTEDAKDFIAADSGNTTGVLTAESVKVEFTNTKTISKDTSLTVRKTVQGDDADLTKPFNFTVTLSDTTINGIYGEMEFVGGVATFTLANGESKTAAGLPEGTGYTVTEAEANLDGYTTTDSGNTAGTLISGTPVVVEIINARWQTIPETGSLSVTKQVTGDGADMMQRFTFTVMLSDNSVTGQYGDMFFNGGVAIITLSHGMRATASGLPANVGYSVVENDYGDYIPQAINQSGVIPSGGSADVVYINHKDNEYGSLSVQKTVVGEGFDPNQVFNFTVTVDDPTVSGRYGEMSFSGGVAHITLRDGQVMTASDLPANIGYTVTEEEVENFTQSSTGASGIIPANAGATAQFVNTYEAPAVGSFSLTKIVTGTAAEMDRTFTFYITLSDANINGVYGQVAFTAGTATVYLRHGQTIYADGLPEGTSYSISEVDSGDYTVIASGQVGVIMQGVYGNATFINLKNAPEELQESRVPYGEDMNAGVGGDRNRPHGDDMNPATGDYELEMYSNAFAIITVLWAMVFIFGAVVIVKKRKEK